MANRKTTQDEFIKKASAIHNNKYDYSETKYINSTTEIKIICPIHGKFEQLPYSHLRNGGCRDCGRIKSANDASLTNNEFIEKSKTIHGDIYDYTLTKYTNWVTKVIIICPTHREFEQEAGSHMKGCGCPKCFGNILKTTEQFIQDAKLVHGEEKYDYSKSIYINKRTKIKIICKKEGHGIFHQTPNTHLRGSCCPKCSYNISKPETSWLDSLNIPKEYRNIRILNYIVDGFDPDTNTIYEFNGDFWHGNPNKFKPTDINPKVKKTYGELYEATLLKEQELKNAGYNLVSIWESDFKN
jgi:hypothetical protein